MEHEYDCHPCGSMYKVSWDPDEVELPYSNIPEFCPYCGAKQDSPTTDDIGIGFTEQIDFDGSVEVVDGDEF